MRSRLRRLRHNREHRGLEHGDPHRTRDLAAHPVGRGLGTLESREQFFGFRDERVGRGGEFEGATHPS